MPVFVVYRNVIGASEALFIYAICSSKLRAKKAQCKAAGFRKGKKFYNVDPRSTPYATRICIMEVLLDRLYVEGLFCSVRALKGLEVIS